jgi:cyclopropane-fatty-acyl-phospholipid synthase
MTTGTDPLPAAVLAHAPAVRTRNPLRTQLEKKLQRLACGSLAIEWPDHQRLVLRGAAPGPDAMLRVHRWRALWRLLSQGDLGLAFAYRDGDWSTPDLEALLRLGALNESAWDGLLDGSLLARTAMRVLHLARANTRRGSRSNIAFHYDLGNAFYAQWLDETMLYSSGIYATGSETLEAAQQAKLDRILALLDTPQDGRVLEIGCGWGALACELAQRHGAQVMALTLSREQRALARERAQRLDVDAAIDVRLQDYRDVDGTYDRIVSIEMLEAVGEAYWPSYFRVLRERLRDEGCAVVQAITIGEPWYERYRAGADFIQRCIFPGGMLPTVGILHEQARAAGLRLEECLHFGDSYARTLADWRERFLAAWDDIAPLGFDERFRRLWEYYLCYCEAGFRTGRIDVGLYRLRPA